MAVPNSSSLLLLMKKKEKEEKPGGVHWENAKFDFQRPKSRVGTTNRTARRGHGSPIDVRQGSSPVLRKAKTMGSPGKESRHSKRGSRRQPQGSYSSSIGPNSPERSRSHQGQRSDLMLLGPYPTDHSEKSLEVSIPSSKELSENKDNMDPVEEELDDRGERSGSANGNQAAQPGPADTPQSLSILRPVDQLPSRRINRSYSPTRNKPENSSYSMAYMAMSGGKLATIRQRHKISPLNNTFHDPNFSQIVSEIRPPYVHFDKAANIHNRSGLAVSQSAVLLPVQFPSNNNDPRLRPATAPQNSYADDTHSPDPVEKNLDQPQIVKEERLNQSSLPSLPVLEVNCTETRPPPMLDSLKSKGSHVRHTSSMTNNTDAFDEEYRQRLYKEFLDSSRYEAAQSPPQMTEKNVEMFLEDVVTGKGVPHVALSVDPGTPGQDSRTMLHGTQHVLPFPTKGVRGKFIRGEGGLAEQLERQQSLKNAPGTIVKSLNSRSKIAHRRTKDIPFVVHNSVLGWKLTTPARKENYLNQITQMGYDEDHAYREILKRSREQGHGFAQLSHELELYLNERENSRVNMRAKRAEQQAIERASTSRRNVQDLLNVPRAVKSRGDTQSNDTLSTFDFNAATMTPPVRPPNPFLEQQSSHIQASLQRFVEEPYLKFVKAKTNNAEGNVQV